MSFAVHIADPQYLFGWWLEKKPYASAFRRFLSEWMASVSIPIVQRADRHALPVWLRPLHLIMRCLETLYTPDLTHVGAARPDQPLNPLHQPNAT